MKSATFFALSAALFRFANAAPFDKRALIVNTIIQEVVQTVVETKTVWVDPSEATPLANSGGQFFETSQAPAATSSSAPQSSASPASSTPPTPPPAPTSAAAPVTPQAVESSAPAPAAPVPEPSSAPAPAPAPQPSPEPAPAPAPQPSPEPAPAPAPAPQPETPAPAPQPSTPAPEPSTPAPPSNGGGSGEHAGEITYYTPGMGACGVSNSESDWIVAVSIKMFEPQTPNGNPNNNPLCNKPIKIYYDGKSFDATITDSCQACDMYDLDMPQAMFNTVTGGKGDGRASGMTWSFA